MDPAWCDTIHHRIRTTEPGEPGSYRYSDLGYYLLQDVLQSLWGQPLDQLADSLIHRPLGLTRIGYRPLGWCNGVDIAPTELDTVFRQQWVRGTVHDPGASMMGGVAGMRGLFSDAHDLAVILETLRRGGEWNGVRLVRTETVAAFTTRAFPEEDNRRAIGWDKPGLEEDSGASGNAGSWSSFGSQRIHRHPRVDRSRGPVDGRVPEQPHLSGCREPHAHPRRHSDPSPVHHRGGTRFAPPLCCPGLLRHRGAFPRVNFVPCA